MFHVGRRRRRFGNRGGQNQSGHGLTEQLGMEKMDGDGGGGLNQEKATTTFAIGHALITKTQR